MIFSIDLLERMRIPKEPVVLKETPKTYDSRGDDISQKNLITYLLELDKRIYELERKSKE